MSHDALFQLGMGAGHLKASQTEENYTACAATSVAHEKADHFITVNGVECAGSHLIIDLYEAERLDEIEHIEKTLVQCVEAAGATLLHIHLHPFEPNGGVSGVAVLAESHISIHSWPERGYAALDIFVCGDCRPDRAVPVLRDAFRPTHIQIAEHKRGLMP